MSKQGFSIAIDGFSSTGKSTLAKRIATTLGFIYVDTGAMYRAVTFYALEHHIISDKGLDAHQLVSQLCNIKISFVYDEALGFAAVFLNGKNVEKEIRTLRVSSFVSRIAEVSEVRALLVLQQQEIAKGNSVVMDGRDIGTVVFPNADLKLFMTATDDVRSQRRYDELISKGEKVTLEEVLANVRERDFIDSNRKTSPLKKASDAIEIDNSKLTIDGQYQLILDLIKNRLPNFK